jgi:hypothetical protein
MEQTAVEWLAEQLPIYGYNVVTVYPELIEQANKMFEQQIKDAYQTSHISMMTEEQYYNETFKQKP